jgi:hypothetical protein
MEKLFLLMPDLTGTRIDLDSQSNKKLTDAEIIAPVGIEKADLPGLVDDLDELGAEIKKEIEDRAAAVSEEIKTRIEKDGELAARLDIVEGDETLEGSIDWHIAQVIDASPAALDTLNELAAALGDDADFAATMTTLVATTKTELQGNINAEAGRADTAEKAIAADLAEYETSNDAALSAEIQRADTAEKAIAADLATEAARADEAEKAIAADLVTEAGRADAAEKAIAADLSDYETSNDIALAAEVQDRIDGDAAEASARAIAIAAVQADVDQNESDADAAIAAEKLRAEGAEGVNADAIAAEAKRASDKEGDLQDAIDAEKLRAEGAEDALDGRLDILEGDSTVVGSVDHHIAQVIDAAPEALDTLKELSTALGDDADFAGSMTTLVSETKTKLEGEIEASSKADAEKRGELDKKLSDEIESNKTESDDADAAIIAAVGYENKGDYASDKFSQYSNIEAELAQHEQEVEKIDAEIAQITADIANLEAEGAPQSKIDDATAALDRAKADKDKVIDDAAQSGVTNIPDFLPINEVNFQAWLDFQISEVRFDEMDEYFTNLNVETKDNSEKADAAIIAAVGYEERGAASDQKFNEYSQEVTQAIEEEGGSEFAPINEVNFEAWKNAKLTVSLEEEVKRAGAVENELDDKISDIISNTDVTSLDSFSEVEEGVNTGFADLRIMMLEIARNSVEINFGAVAADGTQVLFAGYPTEKPKVFVNGLLQEEDVDYTKVDGVDGKGLATSDVTFASAPVAGAKVMVLGVESSHTAEDRYPTPVVFGDGAES